jgi:exo-beta-1,3-glucanase (GH17 family)
VGGALFLPHLQQQSLNHNTQSTLATAFHNIRFILTMKSIVWASALVAGILVSTINGRPFSKCHCSSKVLQKLTIAVDKRALVTDVVYVTETVANVAVYVDENGEPYLTTALSTATGTPIMVASTTSTVPKVTSEPALAPQISSSSTKTTTVAASSTPLPLPPPPVTTSSVEPSSAEVKDEPTSTTSEAPAPKSAEKQPTTTSPPSAPSSVQPAPPPPASSSVAPVETSDDNGSLPLGITYDVYTTGSNCKTPDQQTQDFAQMKDYKVIRIYGSDCHSVPTAIQNALKNGQRLMAGVYLPNENMNDMIQGYKNAINQYANGDWSVIALFSIENEQVNNHSMTASAVIDAINSARGQLRSAGYNGPVGAVETVPAMIDNPAICQASDVVMVNCHAFFDTNTKAENAGTFVKSQVADVKQACNNKRVVVTESGWPHQGDTNGQAVPSPQNQQAALASLRQNFSNDLFFFNAFDDVWKANTAATFNAEQYWGIMH